MKENEQIDDRIYVIQAQLGDDDAFMKLVDHYSGCLLYYIRRLLEDTDRSDDVLLFFMVHRPTKTFLLSEGILLCSVVFGFLQKDIKL